MLCVDGDVDRTRIAYNLRYEGDHKRMKFDDFIDGHLHDFIDKKWRDRSINDDDLGEAGGSDTDSDSGTDTYEL